MNQNIEHSVRAHSLLSASGTYIWWVCPDSVTAFGHLPSTTSIYAEEGTAAHELANHCLVNGTDAEEHIKEKFNNVVVTYEMAEAVQMFVDKCREYMTEGWVWFIEQRFTLEELNPPAPMFGTADFVAYNAELGLMVVIDLKYGKGIMVDAVGNPQLRYYALGAYYALPGSPVVNSILMVIVQPRAARNPIKSDTIDSLTLFDWTLQLLDKAKIAMSGHGGMRAGPHCKFCKGSGRCATEAEAAIHAAQDEFSNHDLRVLLGTKADSITDEDLEAIVDGKPLEGVVLDKEGTALQVSNATLPEKITPADIRFMTPVQISRYLKQAELLENWLTALRQAAHNMIDQGIEVPDFKLVDKRPTSKWKSQDTAAAVLRDLNIPEKEIYQPQELLSPAQARDKAVAVARIARPKITKKALLEEVNKTLSTHIAIGSSGPTLVHVSDPRPPLAIRGTEFDLLPATTTLETTEALVP
jgi:hypothetical protein